MRALVVAMLAAGLGVAHADDEQEAVRHLNLGIAAYKLGHYDEALRELAETDRLAPDRANTHRWFAIVYAKIGDCKSALAHVDGYMARVTDTDKRLPEIVELRDRCLGAATLLVRSTPAGANIRLDGGEILGITPYRALGVHGGSHVVGVDLPGYDPVSRPITMPPTGQLVLDVDLVAHAPPPSRSRWWMWAAGAAAAVAIVGVTYAVTRDGDNHLPPIMCSGGACR